MIGIIDYNMGNVGSIKRKLDLLRIDSLISNSVIDLEKVDKLILPGVGNFSQGVYELKNSGLWDFLNRSVISQSTPILGICLGMQLMGNRSEEGDGLGLGWFDYDVVKFKMNDKLRFKVPHIGWNTIELKKESLLMKKLDEKSEFYFTHSFHAMAQDENDILSETFFEYPFISAVERNHIFGLQFHPEKSHSFGDIIFQNFDTI
jgi:glutamine amidotransferase